MGEEVTWGDAEETSLKVYSKESAPRGIKVDMDYCADPIWVSDREGDDITPYINSDVEMFPFTPAIQHLLMCYQYGWEAAHSGKHISIFDLSEAYEECPLLDQSIEGSLDTLRKGAEKLISEWLIENEWDTVLFVD